MSPNPTTPTTILSRVKKLLALAHDGAATEAEASLAAEHVQRLLQEHGLTLAQVEAQTGSTSTVDRVKETTNLSAFAPHHEAIMASLAENNFCLHQIVKVFRADPRGNKHRKVAGEWTIGWETKRHTLVGRTLNIQVTVATYDYLIGAIERCAQTAGFGKRGRERNFYLDGAAVRLSERLAERRREQEAASRAATPSTNGTGRELVLSDVYGTEADLNNDTLNNFPPGTTAAKRRTADEKRREQEATHDRLVAEGTDTTEAWYIAYGYEPERAAVYAAKYNRRAARVGRGRTRNWTNSDRAHREKVNSAAYQSGRQAANAIGLDDQVGQTTTKRISR